MKRKALYAALAAAGALMGFGSAQAVPAVVAGTPYAPAFTVQVAPPVPIVEVTPAPREGFVWVPGHYEWRDGRYAWIGGHWMAERPGWEWQEARWVRGADGRWYMTGGSWVRVDDDDDYVSEFDDRRWRSRRFGPYGDLDGDGILNRDDRDRDGDGVANWNDDFPNNWRRS